MMIKFVASDLDGTLLLNGAQGLDTHVYDLVERMHERGILFAAASGRQYANMKRMFGPVWDKMLFISENGGVALYKDRAIHKSVIPRNLMLKLSHEIMASKDCELLLCGQEACYLLPGRGAYTDWILSTVRNTVAVLDAPEQVNEDIVKVSLYVHGDGIAAVAADFSGWSRYFNVAISGKEWVDFNLSTKGSVIRMLRDKLGLERDEMMAFGDNFNDEHMLLAVEHSYTMEHASPPVRRMSKHHCARVESVLETLLAGHPGFTGAARFETLL
ncbi:MAG: HAD hydrolase family protein [Oscillospiraceae bacterium]|jgi:hydroxymethylpyrimidine pyrophosphatase-like HAD family hydrolase|nr:HAD hydrolase family protein [Oscillospiraceae bacterium]